MNPPANPLLDIHATRQALAVGQTTFSDIAARATAAAHSPACKQVFMPGYPAAFGMEAPGHSFMPLAGIPVSVKDLFDVAGDVTAAGSTVLADAAPAADDCPAVARLRAAGAVLAGRTNMVEFAFSAVGINPHYGTPVNPCDPAGSDGRGAGSAGLGHGRFTAHSSGFVRPGRL